jgi:hypothetical protein
MSKVAIIGNASGTGVFTVASPNSNVDRVLTLPDETGTVDTLQRSGNVLQVVQTVKVDTYSSTANTWTDVNGLSVSITPTSISSKVLVMCNWYTGIDGSTNPDIMARLARNSTAIGIGNNGGTDNVSAIPISGTQSTYVTFNSSVTYLDSPASTSAITYKLQMRNWSAGSTYYVGKRGLNTSFIIPSFITLMEIAG